VATLAAGNANEAMVTPMVGSGEVWSSESDGRFCVGAFGRNLTSVVLKKFNLVYKEILYILYLQYDLRI
jgi:hypothetical protein